MTTESRDAHCGEPSAGDRHASRLRGQSLTKATARGGAYQVLAGGWEAVVRLAASAVLARLLTPDSFGLVAMSILVCTLFGQLATLSSTMGLVAKAEVNEEDLCTTFWLGAAVYGALFAAVFVTAPALATLLSDDRLASAIRAASLILLCKGISSVHSALLHKRLMFGRMMCINGVAVVFEMLLAVSLVTLAGMTHWALIWSMVASNVLVCIAYVAAAAWRPRFLISKASLRYLLPYGLNGLGVNGLQYLAQNLDRFIIGKMMGASALGLYSFSYRLPELVLNRLAMPVGGTLLPALSNVGGDRARVVTGYAKAARYTALLTFPMLAGMAVLAGPIVLFLWGRDWLPCVAAMQILCLPAMISSVGSSSGAVFLCLNRPDILSKVGAVKLVAAAILVPSCGYVWGIVGVSAGMAASAAVSYATTLLYLRRVTGESPMRIFQAIWPAIASAALCAVAARATGAALMPLDLPPLWMLPLQVAAGVVAYFAALAILFRKCWDQGVETIGIMLKPNAP